MRHTLLKKEAARRDYICRTRPFRLDRLVYHRPVTARWTIALPLAALIAAAGMVASARQPAATASPSSTAPAPRASGQEGPTTSLPRSPRNASYSINARLDPARRTLQGDQVLTWRNVTTKPVRSLRFHLYYNAWRNTQSTWMRESRAAGSTLLSQRPRADWGWIDVTSLRLIGAGGVPTDLTNQLRFVAPDDGNGDDATVMEAPLDAEVEPGQTVTVQMAWSSRVPRTFARTGVIGDFYFLAQWFPKIGVLDESGWNTHQFHFATEFFSDFGVYDVRLTVPSGWMVGATGREQSRRDQGDGTTTHQYLAEDVHDFAWTTSPDFVERTATFTDALLPAVAMRLLLQPEHAGQAERHFIAARATLKSFGEWFGPYPYGYLTIVDPAWQSGADGMEYPTLITAGTRWLAPAGVAEPEGVTVHEAGHQFFYGMVATNEFEHAWMDEGLTTFATGRVMEQSFTPNYHSARFFGDFLPWTFRGLPFNRATDENRMAGYRAAARTDAQATPSWRYWPGTGRAITYNKTALWLHTLERLIGWETLQRVMSTYVARFQFRHPRPEDFFSVANEVSGRDLTWFFDQVHRGSAAFDYGIDQFTSRAEPVRGFVESGDQRRFDEPRGTSDTYRTTMVVRRYQDGIFPIDVRVVMENGEDVRWQWDGAERWKTFELDRPVRAAYAEVDPGRVLLLDLDTTNNARRITAEQGQRAARKWSLTWLIWLQDRLLTSGFLI